MKNLSIKNLIKIGNYFKTPRGNLGGTIRVLGKIILPTKNLSKRNKKILAISTLCVILIMVPIITYSLLHLRGAEAAWFNDNWGYRKSIAVSNSSGGTLSNFQVKILDNKDLSADITAGKIKSDLGDLRFTDINGKLLPYWIEDTTTSSVDAWILIPTVSTSGATIYMYYGNPGAVNANNIKGMTTGGTVTTISGYRIHTFINSRTFTAGPITTAATLVVAGGGGGGSDMGGGGGGGGVIYNASFALTSQPYPITVGLGGNGAPAGQGQVRGTNGQNSVFGTLTAIGGGGGASNHDGSTNPAGNGGSGGGASGGAQPPSGGSGGAGGYGGGAAGTGTSGQGYDGSFGIWAWYPGGGGGAGAAGSTNPANGGIGISYDILGASYYWGGGGGGSGYSGNGGNGGNGGGGGGGVGTTTGGSGLNAGSPGGGGCTGCWANTPGGNAGTNTGGGGGGGSHYNATNNGGNGGSGIVIVRYAVATEPSAATPTNEEKSPAPVAYWKFDEGTGTNANDSSSNRLNGTITGATWQQENQCVNGKCLFFDGTGDYVEAADTTKLRMGTSDWSVSAWIRTSQTGTYQIFDKRNSGPTVRYQMYIASGKLVAELRSTSAPDVSASVTGNKTINDGKWHYVAATFTRASNLVIYVDGVSDGSVSINSMSAVDINGASTLVIGAVALNFTLGFNGFIDEPKIYSYARSAAQIKADYASRGSVKGVSAQIGGSDINKNLSNGLVGFWKMDESSWNGTSGEVADSSGNGNNGTRGGSANTGVGKFGNGGVFANATSDRVNFTSSVLNTTPYTACIWANPTTVAGSTYRYMIANGGETGGRYGFYLYLNNTNNWQFGVKNSSGLSGYAAVAATSATWTHVCGTWDGSSTTGSIKLYVNGIQASSGTPSGSESVSASNLKIGGGSLTDSYEFDGKLDEARVYNRALSPAEVSQLYNFAPGPVAYWNFEEGNGNSVNDTSGNGINGSWNGTGSHWTQGKYGKSGKFNGSTDYVTVPDSSSWNLAGKTTTIQFWYKTSGNSQSFGHLLDHFTGGTPGEGWVIYIYNNTTLTFEQRASTNSCDLSTPSNNDSKWHFISWTFDGSNCNLYVDGSFKGSDSYSSDLVNHAAPLYIGGHPAGSPYYFGGSLDEIRIYNYARTAKQIVSDMNAGHPNVGSPVGSAVGHWKFDEGYGATANNSGNGGNALKGTLYSTTWRNEGKFGKALVFNGTASYVDTPQPTQFSKNSFTNSFWLNISNSALSQSVLSEGAWGAGGRGWGIDFYSADTWWGAKTGYINFSYQFVGGGTIAIAKCNYAGYQNKWVHITAVRDFSAQTAVLYLNGVKCESNYYSDMQSTETNDYQTSLKIGRTSWVASGYLNGVVDEVKVYNSALTADEVKLDYNHGATQILGSLSNTSGLTGGSVASNSASAAYCIPGDTATCSSPVGEWNFEEGNGGIVNDTSGNGNTGTWNGTLGSQWTQGKYGKAGNFNGTDNYVSVSDNSSLTFANGTTATFSFWLKSSTRDTTDRSILIKGKAVDGSENYDFRLYNNTIRFMYYSTGWQGFGDSVNGASNAITINTGQWYHIVFTYTFGAGSSAKFYVNGVLQTGLAWAVGTGNVAPQTNNNALAIGGSIPGSLNNYFPGQLDQVRIYNYARTPAQVAWDYNRGAPVGYWKFDECQGTTINDSSGNSNVGTINGSTAPGTCADGTNTTKWSRGATGKFNNSLYFNGADDNIGLGASTPVAKSNLITVTAWIKPTGSNSRIVNRGWCNQYGWLMHESLGFGVNNSTGCSAQYWASFGTITAGNWYFLTGIFDGSKVYAYKNGVLMNQLNAPSVDLSQNNYSLDMMANEGGQLDEIRIYNYVLTKQQIQQVMNQGAGVRFGPATGTP